MRKVVIIGCFIAGFLLLISSGISTIGYNAVKTDIEKKTEAIGPTVTVRGGLGINIEIYGVSDNTAVSTIVKGFLMNYIGATKTIGDHIFILINTIAFIPCNFRLYVTVYDQTFSFKGHAFYMFIWGITPIDV